MSSGKKNSIRLLGIEFLTCVLLTILWVINLLPQKVRIALGLSIGRVLYQIARPRVSVTRTNISLCFPELSRSDQESVVRDVFRNLGAGMVESAMSWWGDPDEIHRITETLGLEHMEAASAGGRGVIILGVHYSTLDLIALLMSKHISVYAVFRKQKNRVLNYFMNRGRERNLPGVVRNTSMRTTVKLLREGKTVWYSIDQDKGGRRSVYAPFFSHPAATLTTVSWLVRKSGASVVMMSVRRKDDNSGYIVEYLPVPDGFPYEDDIRTATAINQLVEKCIRLAPSQYYWFHKRFKSQPGREKGYLYQ